MRKLLTLTAAAAFAVALGFGGTASAAPTFFLSPGTAATGDLTWQTAVGPFTEFDLDGFACGSIQQNLTDGSTTITIGPGATGQEIFCGAFTGGAGGVFGTVFDRALLNRDSGGTKTANLTFVFSQPVLGFGLWVFDNAAGSIDNFTMTVTESGGAMTTSGVLDANPGQGAHIVEGFIGATSAIGITAVTINPLNFEFFEVDHLQLGGAAPPLFKELTSGPDVDGVDGIDIAIQINQTTTTGYDFELTYVPAESDPDNVIIFDTVPAEWDVSKIDGVDVPDSNLAPHKGPNQGQGVGLGCGEFESGLGNDTNVDLERGGKVGKKCSSSTEIAWNLIPSLGLQTLLVDVTTRQSPSGKVRFKPTSCGKLTINDGAQAFEADENGDLVLDGGNPIPVGDPSNSLMLVAVDDLNGGGLVGDGSGDEDGDGNSDADEAFILGTNPCFFDDADGDGVGDGFDLCPDTNLADTPIDADGCGFSQSP